MTIYLDCNATTPIDPEVLRSVARGRGLDDTIAKLRPGVLD